MIHPGPGKRKELLPTENTVPHFVPTLDQKRSYLVAMR